MIENTLRYGINSIDIMGCCTPEHYLTQSHGNYLVLLTWLGGICEIWGNFMKIWYFFNNFLNKNQIKMQISLPNFAFCTLKSPDVTKKSVSQENAFKKSKKRRFFVCNTIGSNNSFTQIKNNFRFFKIVKFEFKVTVLLLWPMGKPHPVVTP